MKKFLGMGVLALALAAVPTQQASAWLKIKCGFNWSLGGHFSVDVPGFCFSCIPSCCPEDCCPPQYLAVFPSYGYCPYGPAVAPAAEGENKGGENKKDDEMAARQGFSNHSFYRPASFQSPAPQQAYYPANAYYAPQHYYPAHNSYPSYYYQGQGMSFDR